MFVTILTISVSPFSALVVAVYADVASVLGSAPIESRLAAVLHGAR